MLPHLAKHSWSLLTASSLDDIADTLGAAQYAEPDNAEDEGALPQELLDDLIGSKTKAKREGIVTGALPSELAKPLEQSNTAVDRILADADQIANVSNPDVKQSTPANLKQNVLGVCGENTSAPTDDCTGITN